jgi:hypothetical protein
MDNGISVWPPRQDGSKAPLGDWKVGQSRRADVAAVDAWYAQGLTGVGWVCGAVSGNLEVLDFDDRMVWAEYQRMCHEAGLGELIDRMVAGYFEHSPNGAHLVYRCPEVAGNTKLATRKIPDLNKWKAVIETRGEGGFIIVAPSHGSVNARGSYELKSGGSDTIVTITPAERAGLFMVARVFDEQMKVTDERKPVKGRVGERPGDDFISRASWDEILLPHGWTRCFTRSGGVTTWRRPGKDQGISATTNHANSDLFYPFTTSTEFEANRGYSKFSAYGILNHGGDFQAAAQALSLQGYGLEMPQRDPDVDLSGILNSGEAKAPSLSSLMRVPGAVGELADWIEAGSRRSQPVLALGAAIAAMSALIGRKVQTESGMRPNLYVLGIGETGCGKERAREAISKLFDMLGNEKVLGDAFASGAAIETAIERKPVRLFLIDEIGHLLGTMKDTNSDSHLRDIVPVLLRMYSASSSVYRKREYGSKENEAVITREPSLSIYGTTVPSNLYSNLTKAHVTNGLLSRLLVFESLEPYPELRMVAVPAPSSTLMDVCKAWVKADFNADPNAGDIEKLTMPNPLVVSTTARARQVFDDLEQSMRRQVERTRAKGGEQGPYTRVVATALKLSLVRACGISPEAPEITDDAASWGAGMAWRLTEDLAVRVGDAAPENKVEEATQRVLVLVRKAGTDGVAHSSLVRKTQWLSKRQLADTLAALMEGGFITSMTEATGGRPKTTYSVVT